MTNTPIEMLYYKSHGALSALLEESLEDHRSFERGHVYESEDSLYEGVVDSIVSMAHAWAADHGYKEHPLIEEAYAKIEAEQSARNWAEAHGYKGQPLVIEAIIKFQAQQMEKAQVQPSGTQSSGWATWCKP